MNAVSVRRQVSLIHVSDLPIPPSPTTPQTLDADFSRYPLYIHSRVGNVQELVENPNSRLGLRARILTRGFYHVFLVQG